MNPSPVLAVLAATLLALIATLHLYWALGGLWPGTDRATLKAKVLGGPAQMPFPGAPACLMVVAALALAMGIVLQLGGLLTWLPASLARRLGTGLAVMFLLRGLGGYGMQHLSYWRHSPTFNHLNHRLYSPLCLGIAALLGALLST